ncbi:metal-dependent transcriptional regulator [Hydrotalea lipotrueae]|uniref:metal-dependent transcriptional regulator n=1 Tax=Hydrotalea lipotrueae TaxID=2803817 RepID=UPI001C495591|nr:metal-dependent transcriptional regulator [Hydrotalea lipotrueae]
MHSFTEENYLKAIYKLQETNGEVVATSALAQVMGVHSPSVTDMLKRMASKKLVIYQKSKGFKLTEKGRQVAVGIVRKHRLWEVFLVDKLGFRWDEVHNIAEELEHIQSELLVNKLDAYLGYPKADPHGDPIPDENGKLKKVKTQPLTSAPLKKKVTIIALGNSSDEFLRYLDKIGITIGDTIEVSEIEDFDKSVTVLHKKSSFSLSNEAANFLLVNV